MAMGIESLLNGYNNPYALSYGQSGGVFDVAAAQKSASAQAKSLMEAYETNRGEVKTLKADTARFLDQYSLSMKTLGQSADRLRAGGLEKLLYDSSGDVTDATVQKTVGAVQQLAEDYNSSLKLLNDNADRGPGTMKQLARMAQDPAPAAGLKMVGITINDDGTLAVDADKLTSALKTTNADQRDLYADILGGYGGLADSVKKDVTYGSSVGARELVQNDLANIQSTAAENPFRQLKAELGTSVFAMNNMAVTGLLMNMLV